MLRGRHAAVLASLLTVLAMLAGVAGPLSSQEGLGSSPEGASAGPEAPASAGTTYLLLYDEIQQAQETLSDKILGGGAVEAADVERLSQLAEEARLSLYGDLIDRSALLLVLAEEQLAEQRLAGSGAVRTGEIMKSRELEARSAQARRRRSAGLWGSLGTSTVSFAMAFTFWYLSEWQDEQYFLAASVDDAVRHRTYFRLFSWVSYLSAGVGVVSAGISIPFLVGSRPAP